jgi:UrcA family protein
MVRTVLGLAALLASTVSVNAEPVTNSVVVHYDDLNLQNRADVAQLRHRIYQAVVEVCGDPIPTTRDVQADVQHCRHQAMQDAIGAVTVAINDAHRQSNYAALTMTGANR